MSDHERLWFQPGSGPLVLGRSSPHPSGRPGPRAVGRAVLVRRRRPGPPRRAGGGAAAVLPAAGGVGRPGGPGPGRGPARRAACGVATPVPGGRVSGLGAEPAGHPGLEVLLPAARKNPPTSVWLSLLVSPYLGGWVGGSAASASTFLCFTMINGVRRVVQLPSRMFFVITEYFCQY